MTPESAKAEHAGGYNICVDFSDGTTAKIDAENELRSEVFAPLKQPDTSQRFSIHPDLRTICWLSGADYAPEYLYEAAARQVIEAGT